MIDDRVAYIRALSDVTGRPLPSLLKREANLLVENFMSTMQIYRQNELHIGFGSSYWLYSGTDIGRLLQHFEFTYKTCHVRLNYNINDYHDNNIYGILYYDYKISKIDLEDILRRNIKKLLRNHNIDVHKKIKFFFRDR